MGSSFCLWHQMGGIGMDGANKNVGAEGLLKILRCGLERSAEQRTAIQLGDRSQYVGMSDIAKMLDCPRAALAGKLYIPEYRSTDEALKHKITFQRGVFIRLSSDMAYLPSLNWKSRSDTGMCPSRLIWISRW